MYLLNVEIRKTLIVSYYLLVTQDQMKLFNTSGSGFDTLL